MRMVALLPALALTVCEPPFEGSRTLPWDDSGMPLDSHDPDDTSDTEDTGAPLDGHPASYDPNALHSPITPWVRDTLQELSARGSALDERVFMKVGDSISESTNALNCFAGDEVDLGDRQDLETSWRWFLEGDADGTTPYDRNSDAVLGGMSSSWAIGGDPSPLLEEYQALTPSFAVVQFGTNDMHMGTTFLSAIFGFGSNMLDLVDELSSRGVVPALLTIPPRGDNGEADDWVPTYNSVIRGIAQGRQIPLVNLELALRDIDGWGLTGDGVHLNALYDYGYLACQLTEEGLAYGNNTRNLLILDGLDRMRRAVLEGEALDGTGEAQQGVGSVQEPLTIASLPFTDLRDTREDISDAIDVYDGCGASQDESGPEVVYSFELARRTTIRALVFDRGEVDIDLHLLGETAAGAACIERDDTDIETTLDPGTYHVVLDSYVSSGDVRSGEYLFVMVEPEG